MGHIVSALLTLPRCCLLIDTLKAQVPVDAREAFILPLLHTFPCLRGRNDDGFTRHPIGRCGDLAPIGGLQGHKQTQDLLDVAPIRKGILQNGADLLIRINEENRAYGGGITHAGMDHAIHFCDAHRAVFNDGEGYLHAGIAVNIHDPGKVGCIAVHRETEQLRIEILEVRPGLGKGHEFRGTNGREIPGMGEKDDPFAPVIRKADRTKGTIGLELGSAHAEGKAAARYFAY